MIRSQIQRVRGNPYPDTNPVTVDQKEEHKMDFRVSGLTHSVVKEAEHLRVQELVKRIETHPHRATLHADLKQNNVYNPFRKDLKEMIRELGNVELFELCETTPKVQCSHFFVGINCTCGQCLIYSESRRNFNRLRLNAISIPDYVTKKGATHGARHGKTEVQREYHLAWNTWKRRCKKIYSQGKFFYKFTRSISQRSSLSWHTTRNLMVRTKVQRVGWTCERRPYIQTHSRGKREDTKDSGILLWTNQAKMGLWSFDLITEPLSCWKIAHTTNQENQLKSPSIKVNKDAYDKDKKFSLKITCPALELTNIQDGNVGLHLQVPRGGTHPNGVGSVLKNNFRLNLFSWLQLVSFTADSDSLSPTGSVNRTPSHRVFAHISSLFTCTAWLKVLQRVSHKNMFIHMS